MEDDDIMTITTRGRTIFNNNKIKCDFNMNQNYNPKNISLQGPT